MDEENIRNLVKIAADHNIVVYDCDSNYGELTEKLIYLMEETMYLHHKEGPKEFYLPYCFKMPEIRYNVFEKVIYSIPLSKNHIDEYYEKELQCCYGPHDGHLVIMVGDNGTPLLGSF